jgi:hypothetical protein
MRVSSARLSASLSGVMETVLRLSYRDLVDDGFIRATTPGCDAARCASPDAERVRIGRSEQLR